MTRQNKMQLSKIYIIYTLKICKNNIFIHTRYIVMTRNKYFLSHMLFIIHWNLSRVEGLYWALITRLFSFL